MMLDTLFRATRSASPTSLALAESLPIPEVFRCYFHILFRDAMLLITVAMETLFTPGALLALVR